MVPGKDEKAPTFAVGRDGDKIDGIYRGRDPRRTYTQTEEAQLELASRPVKREEPPPPPPIVPRRGHSTRGIVIAIVLALIAFALPFVVRAGMRAWDERNLRMSKPKGLIVIDSTPSDARVFLNGAEVGRTPYVAPNTFAPATDVPIVIKYPGAQDWTGSLPGGTNTTISAELQAK
ncbi:MAG: PEGA domain-containing protein [Myxococcales bacterium]|nr:PEGA domain-containing protein [Myxococcales bacterium]